MSAFLDTLSAVAKKAANAASTEISIATEEQKLRQAYQELGKLYYKNAKVGNATDGLEFTVQMDKITSALEELSALKKSKNLQPDDIVSAE